LPEINPQGDVKARWAATTAKHRTSRLRQQIGMTASRGTPWL
jgi:hypothetical protein